MQNSHFKIKTPPHALVRSNDRRRSLLMRAMNISLLIIVLSHFLNTYAGAAFTPFVDDFNRNRSKLLSHVIGKQLTENHFSHRKINDAFSKEAYGFYIKQIDARKQFFLASDIASLDVFSLLIDNEIQEGYVEFPIKAEKILKDRIELIQKILNEIEAAGIQFESEEAFELDGDKLSFCKTEAELKDRWRKSIKYQAISQYLDLLDINEAKKENAPDEKLPTKDELRQQAIEKVFKSNRNLLHRLSQRDTKDQFDRYFSIVARTFDPHSSFMPPTQKEDFDIHMRGSLEGIGAVLQEDDGYIKVMRIIPGGAAYRQKQLEADDIIMMVAQGIEEPVDLTDMPIRDAVQLIRGTKGTEVRLTVKKNDGAITIIPIIRDVVQLEDTFVKTTVIDKGDSLKFGYLKIPTFYRDFEGTRHGGDGRNVTDDVKQALVDLNKSDIKGLIIDLRNNGGGALVDAVKIAGLFIKTGPVVQIKTSDDKAEVLSDYDSEIYYDGPIVVLINRFSASASEILAGALQDYKRALIVGSEHSYGKGTVQTLIDLDNNLPFYGLNLKKYTPLGALKVTTQKFYRINGESTQHRGVVADIILPDRFKYTETGEQYAENSLPWDKIDPIPYDEWKKEKYNIDSLKYLSKKRTTANEEFVKIMNESEEGRERQKNTLIAIDIASIEKERKKRSSTMSGAGISAHGSYAASPNGLAKKKDDAQSEEELFIEQVISDPYVVESISLLTDSAS